MIKTLSTEKLFDEEQVRDFKIAIVKTDYHNELVDSLEKKCIETLMQQGVPENNIKTFVAPGSWEIPLMSKAIAESKVFDAIITFGVIIKGDTLHFEMIANESARALMQISIDYSMPIILEVLAVFNLEQAKERTSSDDKNKGIEAASSVLKALIEIKKIKKL